MINVSRPLLLVAGVAVCLVVGFVAGYNWCNSGKQDAVIDQLNDDREAVDQLKKQDRKRQEKTIEIKEVIRYVEADNCFDAPAPAAADDRVLEALDGLTRP